MEHLANSDSENDFADKKDTNGYIYIMFNEIFKFYGENVKKIGKSSNVQNRMLGYTTSYIKPVELLFQSDICKNCNLAEREVFKKLDKYRVTYNREFFNVELNEATNVIKHVIIEINNDTYVIDETNKPTKPTGIIKMDDIINSNDINQNEYNELLINRNNLTKNDLFSMEKFTYQKIFKCKQIDEEFMKKYYKKFHVLTNMKYLFQDIEDKIISFDNEYYLQYSKINKIEQKNVLLNLISKFGYNLDDIKKGEKKIPKEDLEKIILELSEWFTKNNCLLFGVSKKKITTIKSFLGAMNGIFNNYGLELKSFRKSIRKDGIGLHIYFYSLLINNNFKMFI